MAVLKSLFGIFLIFQLTQAEPAIKLKPYFNVDLTVFDVKFSRNERLSFGPNFPKVSNDYISTVEISGHVEYLPKQLVKRIPNLRFVMLFEAVKISAITSRFFDDGFERVEGLIFHENENPQTIQEGAFSKLINLKFLTISWAPLTTIDPNAFLSNRYLRDIMFYKTELQHLPENLFDGQEQLNSVDIIYSKIQELPEYLFNNNRELKRVILTNSSLQSIPENLFARLGNLEIVGIDECHIKTLPVNLFVHSRKLHFIGLHSNKLEKISPSTFAHLRKLERVNLLNNICIDKMYDSKSDLNSLESDLQLHCN